MTYHPIATDRRTVAEADPEGFFARMIRLWIEHHGRMIAFGIRPH